MKRTNRLFFIGSLLIILTFFLYSEGKKESPFPGNTLHEEETSPFSPGDTLIIDLRTGGSLHIIGGEGDMAEFDITRRGDAVDEAEVKISRFGSRVELETRYYSKRGGSGGIDVTIRIPSECQIKLNTLGGDVELENLSGEFSGKTLGGKIILQGLSGKVDLETLGGDINVNESALDGKVHTLGGDIVISQNQGNLDAGTLGGRVTMVDSVKDGTDRSEQDGPVKIDSLGGDIKVDQAFAGVDAKTLGGDILILHAQKYVNVETLGGDIDIEGVDGFIKAKTLGGEIHAVMIGDPALGDRSVMMTSLGGDLELTLPIGLDMTVEITIEITKKARKNYQIISDWDLRISEREANSSERKNNIDRIITATSVIGRGTHKVEMSTINGNITLVQKR